MSNKKKISRIVSLALFIYFISLFTTSPNPFRDASVKADDTPIVSDEITISATIGTTTAMTIYGYAPASSFVSLTGSGISTEKQANTSGYFSFDQISTSNTSDEYSELCLIAYIGKYSTQPTCLPPLPAGNNVYNIGPVILSPIISIQKNVFPKDTQVALQGTTTPNTTVYVHLAESDRKLALVSRVLAYNLPKYEVTSNSLGKFEFNLPSNMVAKWKVYASTIYLSGVSPKSNTLSFVVESNVLYYLTKIYETVIKTTRLITTTVVASEEYAAEKIYPNGFPNTNVSAREVESFRSNLLYYVIFIEVLIFILLAIFFLVKKRGRARNQSKTNATV